jgi:sulfate transport system permease protein
MAFRKGGAATRPRRQQRVIPGFGITFGLTVTYLSLVVLIPLSTLFIKTFELTWEQFWTTVTSPRVLAAFKVSLGCAAAAALINAVMGLLVSWVLVRYKFPGRKIVDAMVDLPFALPTAVAGIALTTLYASSGWVGQYLEPMGIKVAYAPLGIIVVLTFIGLPFVVRTVQPVLEDLESEAEEASASLGANRWQTFRRVIFPHLVPPLLTGFAMAFARGIGEYGSVVFISGNMPMKTEIVPLLIVTKLEQYDYPGATALATAALVLSFVLLLLINLLQYWAGHRHRGDSGREIPPARAADPVAVVVA